MKIYCLSDLHLAHSQNIEPVLSLKLPPADVLVLAGDIGYPQGENHQKNYSDALAFFKEKYSHVILVPGNHEYYCCSRNKLGNSSERKEILKDLQNICDKNQVHLLEKSIIIIDGVKFLGTTLWSAIDKRAARLIADFPFVFRNRIDYLGEFIDSYRWLR